MSATALALPTGSLLQLTDHLQALFDTGKAEERPRDFTASLTSVDGKRVLTTKGDANRVPDAWGPLTLGATSQARVAFQLPYVGFLIAELGDRKHRMIVIGLPALLIALSALAGLWRDSTPEGRPQAA